MITTADLMFPYFISNLADKNEDLRFINFTGHHTTTILSTILCYAKQEVDIYDANTISIFNNSYQYCDSMKLFLNNKKGKLRMLFTNNLNEKEFIKSKIYHLLKPYEHQIELKKITNTNYKIKYKNENLNFMITADTKTYYMEDSNVTYQGNFNNENETTILKNVFNNRFNSNIYSKSLNIPL
jgi:hypothetical protein